MRQCFFIFDHDNDFARAKQIADYGIVAASAPAGFDDKARWDATSREGPDAVHRLIDDALGGTSATVVLIGEHTAECEYVDYAIERSIERHNGIVGIFIDDLTDENGKPGARGPVPYEAEAAETLEAGGYQTHPWDRSNFSEWLEEAATEWRRYARPKPLNYTSTVGNRRHGMDRRKRPR